MLVEGEGHLRHGAVFEYHELLVRVLQLPPVKRRGEGKRGEERERKEREREERRVKERRGEGNK
jgi:hypothetical protein